MKFRILSKSYVFFFSKVANKIKDLSAALKSNIFVSFKANMHSAAAHGFAAYDSMRRAEAYRHPLDTQDPLSLQHPLAVQSSNNDHQVFVY